MVTVSVEGDTAVFEVQGAHQLWALKSRLEIALEHITRAYAEPNPPMGWFDGWRLYGADIPHVFRAGAFWWHGNKVFFDVRHPENTVVVELNHENFAELIIEVADPEATVNALTPHLPTPPPE